MSNKTYRYLTELRGDDVSDSLEFKTELNYERPSELEEVFIAAAKDYYHNHDLLGYDWPLAFTLYTADGKLIGTRTVGMEEVPIFTIEDVVDW